MTTFEVKRLKALYQLRLEIVDRAEQEEWSSQRLCIAQAKRGMERMLAALLGQPVEKLAEIRKLI